MHISQSTHAFAVRVFFQTPPRSNTADRFRSDAVYSREDISEASRRLLDMHTSEAKAARVARAEELRTFIKSLDFQHILPAQLAQLGGKLLDREEISQEQINPFLGVELNREPPLNPNQPLDATQHFATMLALAQEAFRNDSSLKAGLDERLDALKTLDAIKSFASSDRLSIF